MNLNGQNKADFTCDKNILSLETANENDDECFDNFDTDNGNHPTEKRPDDVKKRKVLFKYSSDNSKIKPPSLKGFVRKYFGKSTNGKITCSLCNIKFRSRLCFLLKHLKEWHNISPSKVYKNAISKRQMMKDAANIADQNPR